ncbi:DUF397 domain-containing protein [Streptomyces sp. 6N223]|uniref:DUF397 domain-containing protein n=1 Tax=Streptomyces sp. 6N223 TaxID=3457412 RepID=UPI003FCF40C1
MSGNAWQRSSFSGSGGNGECLEVTRIPDALLFRESDEPETVLTTHPARVAALFSAIKGGGWRTRQ